MLFWLQLASAVTGFVAAALWYRSAATKAPGGWEAIEGANQRFLDRVSRLNKWAAGFTGASMLLSAIATLVSATGGNID